MSLKIQNNPFPGLRAFSMEESHLFFGRKAHIETVLSKLERFRFVSVVGNSGSGKSSLVRAGVLPVLYDPSQNWKIIVIRPGRFALQELCKNLLSAFPGQNEYKLDDALEIFKANRLGLVQLVRKLLPANKKLLFMVDQFEELFRYRLGLKSLVEDEESELFVRGLVAAFHQNEVPIYVMMTLRSDFLGDCEQFEGLPEAINDGQFLIPRMNKEEIQESITGPVIYADGKISPRLVQLLVKEIGTNQDQLPVLQHALMRTWELWVSSNDLNQPIDIAHYEKIGTIQNALSTHAEEAFDELKTDRAKWIAETVFKAITLKGADNRGVRRPTSVEDLSKIAQVEPKEIIAVVEVFRHSGRGFLMPSEAITLNSGSVIDISHESLMRVWQRLSNWVNEEAESAELFKRICESALLYEQGKAGLWRDPDLQIALDWRVQQNPNEFWAKQYSDKFLLATHFIDASSDEREFNRRDQLRRKKLTRIVLSIFIVTLSILSFWAVQERNNSRKSEESALIAKAKAEEESKKAEVNFRNAATEKLRAEGQTQEAEKQKKFANIKAMEAKMQGLIAQRASIAANDARKLAENDKAIAILQKQISDSLKIVAENSEKNVYRLRILSISQNLAIKSAQVQKANAEDDVKSLLALQASRFNQAFHGKEQDPEIINALQLAYKAQSAQPYFYRLHTGSVYGVTISKDGKVASCGEDGTIVMASVDKMNNPVQSVKQPFIFKNIVFNEDGSKLLVCNDNKSILVYDANNITQNPKVFPSLHSDQITGFLWINEHWISVGLDNKLFIVNEKTRKPVATVNLPEKVLCIARVNAAGDLVMGSEFGKIYYYHMADSTLHALKSCSGRVQSIAVSSDGKYVACGKSDGKLFMFELGFTGESSGRSEPTMEEKFMINAHSASITSLAFQPGKKSLATGSLDGHIKIWNATNAYGQPFELREHDNWIWSLCFSPDGNYLASGGKDKLVQATLLDENLLVKRLNENVKRDLTQSEWNQFVGSDIPYDKTHRP